MSSKKEKKENKEKKKKAEEKKPKGKSSPASERKMKKFIISGRFMMGDTLQEFQKEIEALGVKRARERIYQDLGSRHRVKRSRVLIDAVEEAE